MCGKHVSTTSIFWLTWQIHCRRVDQGYHADRKGRLKDDATALGPSASSVAPAPPLAAPVPASIIGKATPASLPPSKADAGAETPIVAAAADDAAAAAAGDGVAVGATRSTFHGTGEKDYQGRSWVEAPKVRLECLKSRFLLPLLLLLCSYVTIFGFLGCSA